MTPRDLVSPYYTALRAQVAGAVRRSLPASAFGVLLLALPLERTSAQDGGRGEQRDHAELLAAMVAGWQRLEKIDDEETRTCHVGWTHASGKSEPVRTEAKLAVGNRKRLFASDQILYATSPSYGFLLQRRDPARDEWSLAMFLSPDQVGDPMLRSFEQQPLKSRAQCFWPLSADGQGGSRLTDMLAHSTFDIERIEPGEGTLIVVTYSSKAKDQSSTTVVRGRMVVDKSASYLPIERSRTNTLQPYRVEEKRTLVSKSPLRCGSYTYRVSEGPIVREETVITYSAYTDTPPADDEVRLSHYGLPEPVGVELPPQRAPVYVWLLIAAGGFGLLAVGFVYARRRKLRQ